jgi:adenosylcobinamide-phosphate guanylyltransferase
MDALVMAGGKGSRMGGGEKPMVPLDGKPMLSYVLAALSGSSSIGRIFVTVSSNAPLTGEYVKGCPDKKVSLVMTPGSGYIEDTCYAVSALGLYEPFLIVSADLPLLTSDIIEQIVLAYEGCGKEALSARVTAEQASGHSDLILMDTALPTIPAGINVVHGAHMDRAQDEHVFIVNDPQLAVNVNYRKDLTYCEQLLARKYG